MLQNKWFRSMVFFLFALNFFLFYPPTTGIVDESAYLTMAYTFQKFKLAYDEAGIFSAPASVIADHRLISRYPPGNSLLLLPFTILNWRFSFLRGFILMVVGFITMILILNHYRLSRDYAFLFLLHPSFILYSRTLMSDLPATIIGLLGLLFFIKKIYFLAGLIFGLAIGIRYPMVLIPFSLLLFLGFKKKFCSSGQFLLGGVLGVLPLLLYHLLIANSLTGPAGASMIGFSLRHIPVMFPQFFIFLNILYPLMFIFSLQSRLSEKWLFLTPAIVFILFFSLQYYMDTGENFLETLIRAQRYLLPVIPFLLIPYSEVLIRIKFPRSLLAILVLFLLAGDVAISYQHQKFLNQQRYEQEKLYEYVNDAEILLCNKEVYELVNPFIKPIKWQSFEDRGNLQDIDIPVSPAKLYLACRTRDVHIKYLFHQFLARFLKKEEVFREETSFYYFAIWRVDY
ncbi:MAG: hypothetical protein ABIL40_02775 [candidate division WOR-3 bacterium]